MVAMYHMNVARNFSVVRVTISVDIVRSSVILLLPLFSCGTLEPQQENVK